GTRTRHATPPARTPGTTTTPPEGRLLGTPAPPHTPESHLLGTPAPPHTPRSHLLGTPAGKNGGGARPGRGTGAAEYQIGTYVLVDLALGYVAQLASLTGAGAHRDA